MGTPLKKTLATSLILAVVALPVTIAFSQSSDRVADIGDAEVSENFVGPLLPQPEIQPEVATRVQLASIEKLALLYSQRALEKPLEQGSDNALDVPLRSPEFPEIKSGNATVPSAIDLEPNCVDLEGQLLQPCISDSVTDNPTKLSQPRHTADVVIEDRLADEGSIPVSVELELFGASDLDAEIDEPDLIASQSVVPPIPASVSLRPIMPVYPANVAVIQVARSVSGDPLVHDQVPGSWPRRLDQVNALAGAEQFIVAQGTQASLFLRDWVEVRLGNRIILKAE